jgi:DNA-binding NarL/FixJ family response regulator
VIRVVVADDHGVLRDGLAGVISEQDDMEVVATAADGAKQSRIAGRPRPTSS